MFTKNEALTICKALRTESEHILKLLKEDTHIHWNLLCFYVR